MSSDFLVEIGTEELPPKSLLNLSEAFREEIVNRLSELKLNFGTVSSFASPRRLAVVVRALDSMTPGQETINWGPPKSVAFDQAGIPTRAAQAFAEKNNCPLAALADMVEHDGKQEKLCHRASQPGQSTAALLGDIVSGALTALPIPKRMRWGTRREEFVRPVHWIVMLFGNEIVETEVMGLPAGNRSRGHRFHAPNDIVIDSPAGYGQQLKQAYVLADFAERRHLIREGVHAAAKQAGGHAVIDDDLLNEVTALNEWPVPLVGQFEARFLDVPAEALISSMKSHQKYFHVLDDSGKLMPIFITVANIESTDPEQVIRGNERVIRPRLSDAAFFYETDRQTTLAKQRELLRSIVFQAKLGSLFDKTERVASLARTLSETTGADGALAFRAGELSKSDLVSEMVGEFDDLQGTMGRYYAMHDGEDPEVADALFEQYLPRFAGDIIPTTRTGITLAIADRLDTLVGIFGIGQPPSGSKDPFALRRASLGVLRIIVEHNIDIDLKVALDLALAQLDASALVESADHINKQVLTYMLDRFKGRYEDEHIPSEVFQSVAARQLSNPLDIHLRVLAVHAFNQLPEAEALAAANKRVSNILSKQTDLPDGREVNQDLLAEPAEQALAKTLTALTGSVRPLLEARDYTSALKELAKLRDSVDQFFDEVMVMAEQSEVRMNRLALLQKLQALFLNIADISLLVPAK
ncbi:glycine--tRNA ligase subunit beta [uncultured Porticoccus sp.]|uniref:glycine--tRNA ligase subunit beta n=1 Tax=uncultured Porticoccus sp. TaxID=1256050 RepID=UPI0030D906C4|tara:strand:+ start:750 stop:2840 length:2091 start_codon:yes stop_codon:yes gene_type:complete